MNKRRLTRLVVAIFSASVLFVASGVTPSAWGGDDGGGTGVVCTGTPSDRDASGNPNTCTINHANDSGNNDECSLFSTQPDVTQQCIITQSSVTGNNNLRVRMVIAQSTSAAQPNTGACLAFPLRTLPNANQNGCQLLTVTQTSTLGSNSLDALMAIGQTLGSGTTQRQNAGQQHTVDQCSGLRTSVPPCVGPGTNLATVNLGQGQNESSWVPVVAQRQRSTANGAISQLSGLAAGAPQATRNFGAAQNQYAPACAATSPCQFQDPDDYCCFTQGASLSAALAIRQGVLQIQNLATLFPRQSDQLVATWTTTGNGTGRQDVTRSNGGSTTTFSQSASGKTGFLAVTCGAEGGCFPFSPPPPPIG
jgi:hypothetical protein